MTRILFLYDNLIDSAILTASSAATGFLASNLKNPFRTKVWRTLGTTPGTADLVIDLSSLWAITGSNLVSNGSDFTGGPPPTGWAATNCTLAAIGGGQAGNCLEITRTAGAKQTASQVITCIPGNRYRLHFYVHDGTNPTEGFDVDISGGSSLVNCAANSSATWDNWAYYYFIADQTAITISLNRNVNGAGTMLFDTIEVYEMTGDSINCIALTGYNWATAPGTLDLEFKNYNTGWGAPADHEHLTWHSTPTANGNKATIIKTFSEKKYLYARLNVVYATDDWDLGRIFLGTYFEPDSNYISTWSHDFIDPSMISQTIGGQDHVDELEQFRRLGFSFMIKTQAQWELFQKMINIVGIRKDLFIAFDYDNEPEEMTIYGKFTSLPGGGNIPRILKRADFSFQESR